MPLPKAPTAKGSVLIDIPAELPTQAPAPKAARAHIELVLAVVLEIFVSFVRKRRFFKNFFGFSRRRSFDLLLGFFSGNRFNFGVCTRSLCCSRFNRCCFGLSEVRRRVVRLDEVSSSRRRRSGTYTMRTDVPSYGRVGSLVVD